MPEGLPGTSQPMKANEDVLGGGLKITLKTHKMCYHIDSVFMSPFF